MKTKNPFLDDAGEQVLRFVSAARNLSRLGELSDEVVAVAQTDAWRRYRTAAGIDEWRECEFDYFLIACDLQYEDVSRVIAYTREGRALAPMMDHEANGARRRTLEEASRTWLSSTRETLVQRAQRLGWTRGDQSQALRAAPLPERVRALQAHGMTKDQHAQKARSQRLPSARRRQLDKLVKQLRDALSDDVERLYVIDRLREKRV